jgi:hypothetical protein
VHTDLQQALAAIDQATAGLAPEALTWAPGGKWAIESILEHLDLTFTGTTQSMRKAIEKGPRPLHPTFRQRVAKWLVVDLGYFPGGFKSPEFAVPRGGRGEAIVAEIRQHLAEMDEAITACEAALGTRSAFKHPRLGPLTPPQWRRFHLVHTRHHMKQVAARRASAPPPPPPPPAPAA